MQNTLKILVVLPLYGGSLPIGRYCVDALKALGHVVDTFEAPAFYESYKGLRGLGVTSDRLEYLENSYLQVVSQAVLAKVETFAPDLVLCMAQAPMSRQALKRLKRDKVPTVMWFMEDWEIFTYWKGFAPLYDAFAIIQKEPFIEKLAEVGQKNVLYLPLAADPEFHRQLDLSSVEQRKWGSDVSFMGAGYPNRRVAFRKLIDFDLKIWGNEWDGDLVLKKYNQLDGARVTPEECVKIFNATRVNLNLHSSVTAGLGVGYGDFVNPRTFELASCGAFQLVDNRALMSDVFADDELAFFTDIDDLRDKIRYYLAHDDERRAMAYKARTRVLEEHTYERRMETLLDYCADVIPGWFSGRMDVAPELAALPEELRSQVSELLGRLGLSADVPFSDLVAAVRLQQGELSPLDTTILFLDEWRKQYGISS